jgi:type VI secretion system protein
MAAFLRGAGLPPDAVSAGDSDAALEAAGRLFATMVAGLTDVLATRSEVRNEFRLQQTVIRPRENNPLKFSATTEDALRALLNGRKQGYMPPQQAVEEAVDDVKAHQIAVMAGVQAAVKGLLTRFDPDSLQRRFGAERGVLGLGAGKGRAWDAFVRLYADIAAEAEDDFHAVLGREFAKAYEACGRERGRRP